MPKTGRPWPVFEHAPRRFAPAVLAVPGFPERPGPFHSRPAVGRAGRFTSAGRVVDPRHSGQPHPPQPIARRAAFPGGNARPVLIPRTDTRDTDLRSGRGCARPPQGGFAVHHPSASKPKSVFFARYSTSLYASSVFSMSFSVCAAERNCGSNWLVVSMIPRSRISWKKMRSQRSVSAAATSPPFLGQVP